MPELTAEELATYEWQMWVPGMGEAGQHALRQATVLVSRLGGLGGLVALELAAAGVGRLILAHGGNLKPSDLHRQVLMNHNAIGSPRIDCALARLRSLNPFVDLVGINENITEQNVAGLVAQADVVVCAAPLFRERLLMNREAVRQNKPFVDCAMYELTGQIASVRPGVSACLACRIPEEPLEWKRQFPVFGAVSGMVGCLGAMEAIKLICGLGEPLLDRVLLCDLRDMRFRTVQVRRVPDCAVCGGSIATR